MARTKVPGRDLLDSLTTLILALPGTGIGIAYLRAFREPMPFIDTALIGLWRVIPLILGAVCLFVVSKVAGTKMGGVFG